MHRLQVIVTNAVVDREVGCKLPAILGEQIEGVYKDLPLCIAAGDGPLGNVTSQKVGERKNVAQRSVLTGCLQSGTGCKVTRALWLAAPIFIVAGPRAGGSCEFEAASRVALVKLVDLRLPVFAPKAELMLTLDPRERLVQMPSNIVTPFWWCVADLFKTTNCDVRGLGVRRVGYKAERIDVKTSLLVAEDLVEVVHSDGDLIGDMRR